MAKNFRRRIVTERCILRTGHMGPCEYNNFDPPELLNQCARTLAQIDGGERDGEWVPLHDAV